MLLCCPHSGHKNDGVFGALVVRQPASQISDLDLYDVDDADHVIIVNTWRDVLSRREANIDALLINGRSISKVGEERNEVGLLLMTYLILLCKI